MGTIIANVVVIGIVIAALALAIYSMVRDKKNGKSIQCGGNCKNCGGHCH